MRGRVQVLLLLVFLSSPAFPQCSWTPRASAQFRTTALDVAALDGYLWLATGYGLTLLDADTLEVADAVSLPGNTRVVHTDPRGVAYVGSGSRLYVVTRNGTQLNVVRAIDAGGTVNDIAAAGGYLFVATTNGLAHVDVVDATNPVRNPVMLWTTSTNVSSVAITQSQLFAADGDASVDVFTIASPSIPQRTGELASLPFSAAVHAAGDRVFVSDVFGQNTDVFSGTSRIARLAVGTNAFEAFAGGVHFTAGNDRTLRIVDFNASVPKELYEHTLSPIGGTDHVIHEILRLGNTLYVAAGDIGLAAYDISTVAPPYPIAAYRTAATSSAVMSGDRAWFADASGTITETSIDPAGLSLATLRTWNGGIFVHDVAGTSLLTSNGTTATIWSLAPATPAQTHASTFRTTVAAARLHGDTLVALLSDGTVWRGGATPQQIALPKIAFLDRAGTTWTFAENRDDGVTVVHLFASDDLSATPVMFTIPGTTTGLATSASRVAVYTFSGLRVINHSGQVHATLNLAFNPRRFTFSGNDLLVLGDRTLDVYQDAMTLVRSLDLPANVVAVDAEPSVAAIATTEGMMAVSYLGAPQPPPAIPFASRFYSKVVAAGDRAYLFDRDGIDVFSTATGDLPRYLTSVSAAGVIDVAATEGGLFTLAANGTVTAYSTRGVAMRTMVVNEGTDQQMIAIDAAGSAVWISISKGCLTGGCQNRTLVLDPATMSVTSSMSGAVLDVVVADDLAYALFELPGEVRVIDVSNPLQPAQVRSIPSPNRAASLAPYQNRVFVLGDRLYEYSETLVLRATHLPAISPDRAQQVRVEGNCLLLTARGTNPETYNAATMIPAPPQYDVPSPVRSVAVLPGKVLLLTSHSLEVWSSQQAQSPKRRVAR
jgi:hypothetical protein